MLAYDGHTQRYIRLLSLLIRYTVCCNRGEPSIETSLLLVLDGDVLAGGLGRELSFRVDPQHIQRTFLKTFLTPSEIFSVVLADCLWPARPRMVSTPLSAVS